MFEQSTRVVASSNGVRIAVYDEPAMSGSNPPILFSHATGFHGRVFAPVAEHLRDHDCITFDYRGYGDTPAPHGWSLTWGGFGDDALA
ncbi:MAG: alpha/beta hydrolase, partial [Actinomycetota bacterium]